MRAMTAHQPPVRIDSALRAAATRLPGPEARHEAEHLLLHVLGRDRAWLFAHGDAGLTDAETTAFDALLTRRIAGEPVAYLTGHRGFWTLDLQVSPATLIPRPETERLVELALERLSVDRPWRVADLGTGTGAIALSLASERPQARVIATDLSADALAIARMNAVANGIAHVEFRQGSWWTPLRGERFHLIASNPPYIADGDAHLTRGDLQNVSVNLENMSNMRYVSATPAPVEGPNGHVSWILPELPAKATRSIRLRAVQQDWSGWAGTP